MFVRPTERHKQDAVLYNFREVSLKKKTQICYVPVIVQ
jgi:hypothetical protein